MCNKHKTPTWNKRVWLQIVELLIHLLGQEKLKMKKIRYGKEGYLQPIYARNFLVWIDAHQNLRNVCVYFILGESCLDLCSKEFSRNFQRGERKGNSHCARRAPRSSWAYSPYQRTPLASSLPSPLPARIAAPPRPRPPGRTKTASRACNE